MKNESEKFLEFWAAWPNKKAKGDARKAWGQMGCEGFADEVIAAIPDYIAHVQKHEWLSFAHPATWLRAERWEDEFDEPASQVSSGVSEFLENRQKLRVVS